MKKLTLKVAVIGSGPAGISVAKGLLERGCHVTLLDVGKKLSDEKNTSVQQKILYPNKKNNTTPFKLSFGSSYVYDGVKDYFSYTAQDCYFHPSFAQGGLSNVWGAVLSTYAETELSHWPSSCRNLDSYYQNIIHWIGLSRSKNKRSSLSSQAIYLMHQWSLRKNNLFDRHIYFDTAELAVDFNRCTYCRSCQIGCPDNLIYHSGIGLDDLKKYKNFSYQNQCLLKNFRENSTGVYLDILNLVTTNKEKLFFSNAFIACGIGISSFLYLQSIQHSEITLTLKDSQHFILPCLLDKPFKDIAYDSAHALCQLKLHINQQSVSQHPIYLQLYTYMDLYQHVIKNKLKQFYATLKPLIKFGLERLVVIQGYLHSAESNTLQINKNATEEFYIQPTKNMDTENIVLRCARYLRQHRKILSLTPIPFLATKSLVGQSNHLTSSIPMTEYPSSHETDIWGKPPHLQHTYFVDGSILPTLPAGPITLTIMANAYRIGLECPL